MPPMAVLHEVLPTQATVVKLPLDSNATFCLQIANFFTFLFSFQLLSDLIIEKTSNFVKI